MEFMYCIPDLEVFIDKTIKKCLLEYDLDANDTEAVLDDMEKAWPKSPPKSPETNVTKDCNGNTEKEPGTLDLFRGNQIQEAAFSNMSIDKAIIKGYQSVTSNNTIESSERLNSNDDLSTSNGLAKSPSVGGDCSRSDTSSPDAGDGLLQQQKHSKLKSRLQQRYFEGNKASSDHTGLIATSSRDSTGLIAKATISEGALDSCDGSLLAPSNLHLLASAANLHTKRSRRAGGHVTEGNRYLREQTVRRDTPSRSLAKVPSGEPESARDMPVLTRLMSSPLPSSSSRPEVYNNHCCNIATGSHQLHGVIIKKHESHAAMPGLGIRDCEEEMFFNEVRLQNNKHSALSVMDEKVKYSDTVPGSNLNDLTTPKHGSPTIRPVQGIHCAEEAVDSRARLQDTSSSQSVNQEKAKRLLEHYQKGYHSVIPRDLLVVRTELSPSSEAAELLDTHTRRQQPPSPQRQHPASPQRQHLASSQRQQPSSSQRQQPPISQRGNLQVQKMKRRLSPSFHGGDIEDKNLVKQLSSNFQKGDLEVEKMRQLAPSSENRDLQVKKMRQLAPSSENRDLQVKKMRKQPPFSYSEGNAEVREPQNPKQISHTSLSLNTPDQSLVSAPNYYQLPTPADGLEYTSQHPHGFKPDGFSNHHYQISRIASIIVEELEKDNRRQPHTQPHTLPHTQPHTMPHTQPHTLPREIIPSVHKFTPERTSYFGHQDLLSRTLKPNSLLSLKSPYGLSQMNKDYYLVNNGDSIVGKNSNPRPQLLPAHTARPSHSSVSALVPFHHAADVKNHKVTAYSFASDKTGVMDDDNNQPEDLSIKSNNSARAEAKPVRYFHTKSSPNRPAVEEQSQGYFSSPTSPVLSSLLGCLTESSPVLQKPSSSSARHNHNKECDYSSDSETATTSFKTSGKWEKKGQVHGLDIPPKGDSKAVEKRRAETLKTCSHSGDGSTEKSRK